MRHANELHMAFARFLPLALLLACASACVHDSVGADDIAGDDVAVDAGPNGPDADVGEGPCDMTGVWIVEQHTVAVALSTTPASPDSARTARSSAAASTSRSSTR